MNDNIDYLLRIAIVGGPTVGKSNIMSRYVNGVLPEFD